eukprot:1320579-Rhodomonas_salina.1
MALRLRRDVFLTPAVSSRGIHSDMRSSLTSMRALVHLERMTTAGERPFPIEIGCDLSQALCCVDRLYQRSQFSSAAAQRECVALAPEERLNKPSLQLIKSTAHDGRVKVLEHLSSFLRECQWSLPALVSSA